ncbi:hypothetical protein JCM11641_000225 [Rhodosporidiobolus odoratus]
MSLMLTSDIAYPIAVGTVGVYTLLTFASVKVGRARKAAGVQYPACYAENSVAERDAKANKFNCAQRAHANTIENLPVFLLTLIHSSVYHPKYAAAAGALWIAGRYAYIIGYCSGDPEGRRRGFFGYAGGLPLLFFSMYKAVSSLPFLQ